jgi:SPP1 gp7 family putative phage head morphogenesis protein
MSNYWQERMAKSQNKISDKNIAQIEKQMKKYYKETMKTVIEEYEKTLLKIMETELDPNRTGYTPADLYKLDRYWMMQKQVKDQLEKLGDKQIAFLSKKFELSYFEVYHGMSMESDDSFIYIDTNAMEQVLKSIWVADGKSWSDRVWDNTKKLQQMLNDELINCVVAGKRSSDLKKKLMERFSVSYSNADMLVRTEIAHIQTEAAKQRYTDYGIKEVEILADEDERRCEECGKLHGKRYPVGANIPIPAHPRCRCCIVPVVEEIQSLTFTNKCEQCGRSFETKNEATTVCAACKELRRRKYARK